MLAREALKARHAGTGMFVAVVDNLGSAQPPGEVLSVCRAAAFAIAATGPMERFLTQLALTEALDRLHDQ